jgi:hypothetical protein
MGCLPWFLTFLGPFCGNGSEMGGKKRWKREDIKGRKEEIMIFWLSFII